MCGLTGILDSTTQGQALLREQIREMNSRQAHRGPDAEGIWVEQGVALAHRRLSILDLSEAGTQPMLSPSGRFVIAYNGEIYNHLDLRAALEQEHAAPDWRGHSDTETLLAAIEHWGLDEALRRSAGMFALALWDRKARCLSLARDRIGEKPLYWGRAGRALVFGSELKALSGHPDFNRAVDTEAFAQYLRYGCVAAPCSIYQSVYKVEPGTILSLDLSAQQPAVPSSPIRPGEQIDGIVVRRFWSVENAWEASAADPLSDGDDIEGALDALLRRVVRRQMLSDVPLGAFLSGGVDSSTIVALMQAQSERPIQTFTIGFDVPEFDESPYAEAVARHLGTAHTTMHVSEHDARNVIPLLSQMYDEPFADSSQIPTALVCRAARSRVTVALSGDGGDELFGGYNRYLYGPKLWRRIAWSPYWFRWLSGQLICALPESWWNQFGFVYSRIRGQDRGVALFGTKAHRVGDRLSEVDDVDALHKSLCSIWSAPERLLSERAVQPCSRLDDPMPGALDRDLASRMMVQDLRFYLPDDILCKVDRAAMAVGLETRAPFLDPEVIEFAMRIPLDMKLRSGIGKWALRQVLYRYVPKELIERPKVGFSVPLAAWLRGPLRDWAEDLLSPAMLDSHGLLDGEAIRRRWEEHQSGRKDWAHGLWAVLMFNAWFRMHGQCASSS